MARPLLAPLLLLSLGCGPSEVDRVRAALARPADPAACAPIEDVDLRGECVAMAAGALAATDPVGAEAACRAMAPGMWRDECFFLLADTVGAHDAEAQRLCAEAGRYQRQCEGHALSRAVAGLLAELEVAGGRATLDAVEAVVIGQVGAAGARQRAEGLVVAALARREPGAPFSRAWCSDLPDGLCASAYEERVREAALRVYPGEREGWRAACGRTVSAARATQVGLPAYALDAETLAAGVWQGLCRP